MVCCIVRCNVWTLALAPKTAFYLIWHKELFIQEWLHKKSVSQDQQCSCNGPWCSACNNVVNCTLFVIAVVTSRHFRCILSPINTFFHHHRCLSLVTPFTINGRIFTIQIKWWSSNVEYGVTVVQSNYLMEYQTR